VPKTAPDVVRFRCKCGVKLKIPKQALGRRIRCPKCSSTFVAAAPTSQQNAAPATAVPAEPARAAPAVTSADHTEAYNDESSLFSELAASETAADALSQPDVQNGPACPNCGSALRTGMVVCQVCGHGKPQPKPAKESAAHRAAPLVGKLAISSSRFMLGCALSAVGAVIGGAIWYGIAMFTGFQIGYVAIGVGALTGFGMLVGYGQQNIRAALVASALSVGAIMSAKLIVFFGIILPFLHGGFSAAADLRDGDRETQVRTLVDHRVERLRDQADTLASDDTAYERLYEKELPKVQALSDSEFEAELAAVEAWHESGKWEDDAYIRRFLIDWYTDDALEVDENSYWDEDDGLDEQAWQTARSKAREHAVVRVEQMSPEERRTAAQELDAASADVIYDMLEVPRDASDSRLFFKLMFEWWDVLWVILAVGGAFKIAGGELE